MHTMDDVLEYWLGPEEERDTPAEAVRQRWWTKDPKFDRALKSRFGGTLEQAGAGALGDWLATPRGRLALVIVLDQFSRNVYRGSAAMYANDERAVALALGGLDQGVDRGLRVSERQFLYMPLMHAENLELQERSVALFRHLAEEAEGQRSSYDFAVKHRDIIVRFGRFPHRNGILSRTSTAEELEFLTQPGSGF